MEDKAPNVNIHAYLPADVGPVFRNNPEAEHASSHRILSIKVARHPLTWRAGSHEVQTCALMPAIDFVQKQEKLDKDHPRKIQRRAPEPSVQMTMEAQFPLSRSNEGSSICDVGRSMKRRGCRHLISHLSKAAIIEELPGSVEDK